ncbi:DNA recombination protein RmuC, partial [Stenotrophomonas sp. SrG]|uniref:DNA recombination protein RmuC n=1 Tax=Stenotrophomonas sp. SrG TaxID=3414430 RepID=UPI003CF45887
WGEEALDHILEPPHPQAQSARGVIVRPARCEMVDIAVRLPGRGHDDTPLWLPIESKIPREDYDPLLDAQEHADADREREQA